MKMNWYQKYTKTAKDEELKDYGWVKVELPESILKEHSKIAKKIPDKELFKKKKENKDDWGYGIENDPHITVKWGIISKNPNQIKNILEDEKGGNISLEKLDLFDNDEYDVLKINVKSKDLNRLNKKLTDNLKTKETHPDYNPHITVGYLKKGEAEKYIDKKIKNTTFPFDKVIFVDSENKETEIALND